MRADSRPSGTVALVRTPLEFLAELFDSSAYSPASIARRIHDAHLDRVERRATADPRWSAIEARRHRDGSEFKIYLSEDLTPADWEEQRRIEKRLTPDPFWLPWARRVSGLTASSALSSLRAAIQRLTRGWDDSEVWSLNSALTSRLADQLVELAERGHGWPGELNGFDTPKQWEDMLLRQAQALRCFDGSAEYEAALSRWHDLHLSRGSEAEADLAWKELDRIERENIQAAKQALHWVAENLELLWD